MVVTDWFICYFGVLGKSFREVFGSFLTCFSDSYRSIFGTNFRVKIVENTFLKAAFYNPFQPVLGRIFDVESEFEVKNSGFRRPGAEI